MSKYIKFSPGLFPSCIDLEESKYFIYQDSKMQKTTVVIYARVLEGYSLEFIDKETVADIQGSGKLILRDHYKDKSKSEIDEFKKDVMSHHKDWRKVHFESTLLFDVVEFTNKEPHTCYFKFQLPGIHHDIAFKEIIA